MKFFEEGELKQLWPFYLEHLLSPLLFFTPIFMLVYFKSIGLSTFQYGVLLSAFYLATIVFEIPTGAIADLFGRKFSVIFGFISTAIGYALILFTNNFYLLLVIMAFIGFANTLPSGAKEAWIADLIKARDETLFHKYLTKSRSVELTGLFISGFLGAFLVKTFGISVIWIAAALAYTVSIPLFLFAEEHFKKKKVNIKNSLQNIYSQAKTSIGYSYDHPVLFYFILAGMIVVAALGFGNDISWISLLINLKFPEYALGYLWSGMALTGIIAPFVSKLFYKEGKEKKFIMIILTADVILMLLVPAFNSLLPIIIILLISFILLHARYPVERVYFHSFIPSKLRATIGSIESMMLSLVALIVLPIVGFLIDKIGPKYTIMISGVLLIPAVLIYFKIKEPKK